MRLSRRADPQVRVRVAGIVVVHIQTSRVEIADINKVAIGRAPSLLLPL